MGEHSAEYFHNLLEHLDTSIAEHKLIYDDEGQAVDYQFIYVNDAFCRTLKLSRDDIIGQTVKKVLPSIEDIWIDRYAKIVAHQKPNRFVMYSASFDAYFNVYAYPSGKDTFVASFTNVGSVSPRKTKEEFQQHQQTVAMMEYNRILEHILTSSNVEELVGQGFNTFDEYQQFVEENIHPEDKYKIIEFDREVRELKETSKMVSIRIHHKHLKRYVWLDLTIFVKSFSQDVPEIITVFAQNKDLEFEQLHMKNNMERLFRETKKVANIATFLYDVQTATFEPSKEMEEFLGVESFKTLDDFRSVVHSKDLVKFDQATEDIVSRPDGRVSRYRIKKYGESHHLESFLYGQQNEEGQTVKVFGIIIDRTSEVKQRKIIENARSAFERVFNLSPSGIFAVDHDFEITLKNDKFKEYLEQDQLFESLQDLLKDDYDQYRNQLLEGINLENIRLTIEKNNMSNYYHLSVTPIEGNFKNKYFGTVVDITDLVRSNKEIEYLSTHDMLTNLYNRHSFDEKILSLDDSDKNGIIVCDIDGLKLMNDAFGHVDGDKLLVRFAEKLQDIIKQGFISRIGGDEFGVIIEQTTTEELEKIASEIVTANKDIRLYEVDFSVSIGYSLVHESQRFVDAFKEAENRMYRMKLKQRGNRKNKALQSILSALDERSEFHKAHREQVAKYAQGIMLHLGYKRTHDLEEIKQIGLLHDVGKIVVNEQILGKIEPLTNYERKMIHYHSESGYKIISNIIDNEMIGLSVLYHHENYDGSGYPHGIKGDQIPLYSRVIRIADSFDIMIRSEGYKDITSPKKAVEELLSLKGSHYDPELVDAFIQYLKEEGTI